MAESSNFKLNRCFTAQILVVTDTMFLGLLSR